MSNIARNSVSSIGSVAKNASDSLGNMERTGLTTEQTFEDLSDTETFDDSYPKTFEDYKKEAAFNNTGVNLTRN